MSDISNSVPIRDSVPNQDTFLQAVKRLAPGGGVEFSGATFRQLIGPGVYVWLRGDEALYVGASRTAFARAADRRHHKIKLGKDVADADSVLFYPCGTLGAALNLERELISSLRPRYNDHSLYHRMAALLGYKHARDFRRQYGKSLIRPPAVS